MSLTRKHFRAEARRPASGTGVGRAAVDRGPPAILSDSEITVPKVKAAKKAPREVGKLGPGKVGAATLNAAISGIARKSGGVGPGVQSKVAMGYT